MTLYNNRSLALERGIEPRPHRGFAPLGRRLAALLLGTGEPGSGTTAEHHPAPLADDAPTLVEQPHSRFPLVRRGYDREAADEYIGELERELAAVDRELAELRGGAVVADEVASEIKRIGEQTSAVLLAAHQQRDEILRRAREEADRCVADATDRASALTATCEDRLRALNAETETAQSERARLLDDLRTISAALAAVADSADDRIAPGGA